MSADSWYTVLSTPKGWVVIASDEHLASDWRACGQVAFSAKAFEALFTVFPGSKLEGIRRQSKTFR